MLLSDLLARVAPVFLVVLLLRVILIVSGDPSSPNSPSNSISHCNASRFSIHNNLYNRNNPNKHKSLNDVRNRNPTDPTSHSRLSNRSSSL